jgi:hypothetical protein
MERSSGEGIASHWHSQIYPSAGAFHLVCLHRESRYFYYLVLLVFSFVPKTVRGWRQALKEREAVASQWPESELSPL